MASNTLHRQRSREQILTQRKPGTRSTYEKNPERKEDTSATREMYGVQTRYIRDIANGSQEENLIDNEQTVDVLSRSESPDSSHNEADGESSDALLDSSGRPIEYYRKNKRASKYHAAQKQSYGEEDNDYDEINLGQEEEEAEYENEYDS